jgi:hypothetical protein
MITAFNIKHAGQPTKGAGQRECGIGAPAASNPVSPAGRFGISTLLWSDLGCQTAFSRSRREQLGKRQYRASCNRPPRLHQIARAARLVQSRPRLRPGATQVNDRFVDAGYRAPGITVRALQCVSAASHPRANDIALAAAISTRLNSMLSAPDAGYTSGNPASAGWGLLRGLVKQGVLVRYPGDFGWPQVSIAGRILASSAFARAIALFSEISSPMRYAPRSRPTGLRRGRAEGRQPAPHCATCPTALRGRRPTRSGSSSTLTGRTVIGGPRTALG